MSESVLARIAGLNGKPTSEIRSLWEELFGSSPPPFNRRYLEDRIGYRLQELHFGGLSPATKAKLDRLADDLEPKTRRRHVSGRPIAGTELRRQWQGVEHGVTVREHDFEYQGRPFKSLSSVARAIAGSRWNGWLFFGLKR